MASVLDTRCGGMEEWLEGGAFWKHETCSKIAENEA